MGSTRAGGRAAGGQARRGAGLVAAAAELRWARPDLTAALADHVLEEAAAAGEQERWLAAAGWAVHARSVTGDGRKIACDVLAGLQQWGGSALAQPAARRLRVELAMVAAGAGEVDVARSLIAPVAASGDSEVSDAELQADLLCVRARCAVEDAPDEVNDAISAAAAAWAGVAGPAGEFGGASVALVSAVVERRAGRPVAAVDHAADGLSRLERGRGRTAAASGHLAAALAAEWIAALLDAGRGAEARDGCNALLPGLSERARPSRQMALLRLTVARAVAAQDAAADTAQLLEQAAEDAAGSDVPDLEAVCRTALGALYEKASRLDTALESLQLAVSAERRDRARSRRFVAALAELAPEAVSAATSAPERKPTESVPVESVPVESVPVETALTASAPAHAGPAGATLSADGPASDATTVLPAITRGDRKLARRRWEELLHAGSEDEPRAAADGEGEPPAAASARSRFELMLEGEQASDPVERAFGEPEAEAGIGWGGVSWSDSAGDSPIGDLLSRSMRSGAADEGGSEHRNGRTPGEPVNGDGAAEPRSRRAGRRGSAERSETEHPRTADSQGADSRTAQSRSAQSRSAQSKTAHSEPEPASELGGWMPAVDAARSDERRRRRGRTRSRSGSDDAAASPEQGSATAARREPRADHDAGTTASSMWSGSSEASTPELPPAAAWVSGNSDLLDPAEGEPRSERRSRTAGRDGADAGAERAGARGRHDRTAQTGDDPAPGRRRRESASTDPLGVAFELPTGAHAGPDTAESVRESLGAQAWGTAPANGRRHRADDPWATGSWTVRPTGRSDTQPPAETPAEPVHQASAAESPAVEPSAVAGGSDSWLEAALADLDRALGSGLAKSPSPEPDLEQDGCAVVIDIARDGRRFAGRRAGAVVRSVADRLTDRLPHGARLRFGDSDILSITGPGWSRSEATEWMHRTLPGLLDGFESEEDLPAAQLRAAVHDSHGPVGAQILQNLARSPGRRRVDPAPGAAEHGIDPRSELGKRSSEARGREYRAAGRSGRRERATTRSGTRSRRDAGEVPERPARHDDPRGWPWAGADADLTFQDGSDALSGLDVELEPAHGFDLDRPRPGRHEANGRAAGDSSSDTDGPPASRHRAGGAPEEPAGAGRRVRRSAAPDSGADSTSADRERTTRGNDVAPTRSARGDHRARGGSPTGNGIGSNGTAGGAGALDEPWTGGSATNGSDTTADGSAAGGRASGGGRIGAGGSAAGGSAAGDDGATDGDEAGDRATGGRRTAAGGYAADGSAAGDSATGDDTGGGAAAGGRATGGSGRTGGSGTGGSAAGGARTSGRRSGRSEPGGGTDGTAANGGGSNGGGSNGRDTDRSRTGRGGAGSGAGRSGADGEGGGKPDAPEPTDGLGIADLLAGALAAYRGI